jgi:Amt family ammonium transporter
MKIMVFTIHLLFFMKRRISIMDNLQLLINIVWTMIAACLVFFMQAGFAMVETGFTRAKNAGNILMKNLMDFVIGTLFFFIAGFGIMFGDDLAGIIGLSGFFNPQTLGDADGLINGLPVGVFMIFQTVFCATAATIVSGAMAERTKFISYLIYSACISLFIYPVTGHWIWGGGWLADLGFHDFAGSTAVHAVGGWCALIGAKILGPRIGKYGKDGKVNAIPGHNLPLGALGVFILWFCWFGFNAGSTIAATTNIGDIAMTTNLAAAAATLATLIVTWIKYGKPDISMTFNGSLAGLVAITAGCDVVSYWGAVMIGLIAGIAVVFVVEFVDKKLKIDDPVGATGVHWACGILGTFLTGVFITGDNLAAYDMTRMEFIGVQLIGIVSVGAFTACMAFIIFTVINKTVGLRVTQQEEEEGLDIHEHGTNAYSDFQIKL